MTLPRQCDVSSSHNLQTLNVNSTKPKRTLLLLLEQLICLIDVSVLNIRMIKKNWWILSNRAHTSWHELVVYQATERLKFIFNKYIFNIYVKLCICIYYIHIYTYIYI